MSGRFVLFGRPDGQSDTVVNTDWIATVEQIQEGTNDKPDVCRLWLGIDQSTEAEPSQDYVDVVGCLFEIHGTLNGGAP